MTREDEQRLLDGIACRPLGASVSLLTVARCYLHPVAYDREYRRTQCMLASLRRRGLVVSTRPPGRASFGGITRWRLTPR